ncbi:DnaJ-like protein subfamily C GRV2, partial [Diplonema papillatum]
MSISSFLASGKEKNKTQEEKQSLAHEFLGRFHVVKAHQWRGKFPRIFCVGRNTVATIDPSALFKLTNEWKYGQQFFEALPKPASQQEFLITVGKGRGSGTETMTFASPDRAEVLTELQKQRKKFASRDAQSGQRFTTQKLHWNEEWAPCTLSLDAHGIVQLDAADADRPLGCYEYWLISSIGTIEDVVGGLWIRYSDMARLHVYQCDRKEELIRRICEMASKYIGHTGIATGGGLSVAAFEKARLGKVTLDELMSVSEFGVTKHTIRHRNPVRRQLCIAERHVVERDPATYSIVTARLLEDVFALIRCEEDSQQFNIEFKDNAVKAFNSTERDSLLAALLDGVRRAGNLHCCIKMSKTDRGQRAGTLRRPVPESTETTLLRVMGEYDVKADRDIITYPQLIRYFNNNVEYSGLVYTEKKDRVFAENKEKLQQTAITALLVHSSESPTPEQAADLFYALRRLAASRTGFEAFTRIPGFVRKIGKGVITGLKMRHDAVSHAAIDFLAALLYPMHDRYDSFQMQQNRLALLASQQFISNLVTLLRQHALANTGALVVSALLDFFVFALCPPYSGTTESSHFNTIVETLAEGAGPAMFRLYLHPCMALGIASGMLMKTIVQECETQASRLQRYALSEGTLLRQFYQAIWSKSVDQRELAIQLIALWTVECPEAQELFKRMLPVALLSFLQSKNTVPETADPVLAKLDLTGIASSHWRLKMGVPTALPQPPDQPPVVLRKSKNLVNVTLNWPYFFYQLQKDHTRPDVIWNHHTREELRESVSRELALLSQGTDTRRGHDIAWNHVEFEVLYECLKDEIRIGSHFLRILLEDPNPKIVNPREFFYDLYHRYLLVSEVSLKAQCMHGMARLYETYAADIGVFNDLSFIVGMVKTATDKLERDRLLLFLSNLLRVKGNVKLFIDCHGVPVLIDLLTLAHTHTDRAQLRTQANVIEMNPDHSVGSEPEWFYQDKSGEQQGPVGLDVVQEMYKDGSLTAESKLWAQGLDAWHAVKDVPQLKWSLIYEDAGCLNPTELSCLVLDMLIRMCSFYPTKNEDGVVIRPVPRIKRMLAQATVLPHIVQIFLTLDPGLVSRTAILLCALMEDNPGAAARLYLTGAFFFALMYMGSDIKPIVRLFHTCHDKQAFRSDEGTSVLSPMLPKAMVCFLCNHGIDKFSERFLGEFDDPETIWGTSMRQHLVQKIAVHLMDFTPKLRSNTRAIYTYCPITPVAYNQLENELFCNIYYLRHLCDTHRFPEWPITNKIELLRDTLGEWRAELEKKGTGSSISRKEALEALDIKVADDADTDIDPSKVRRAYFILAARYHPDKNPEGREKFEEILKAYEFLANPNQPSDFPDPKRIDLLMRTQSILYKRFKDELSPYKYAGYPMLLQHIGKEAADPQLFALETPLLPSASELCLHTVNASPLNAEELLREGGLQLLKTALERCSDVVVDTTTDSEMPALVSMRIVETFAVAADFESCRSVIQDMPGLVEMICKGITSKKAPRLAKASIACTSAFAAGESLQDQLYKAGVLWHLLLFIFGYDYTLDEGGVDKSADTNVQELKNVQAKAAIFTICRLCGFMNTTKPHAKFTESLSMLLTPYVVNRLHEECKGQPVAGEPTVLKLLNSNSETPYMLWNNGTRAELTDFLEKMQEAALKGHEVSAHFEYSSHKRELLVGGVFVRLYNEQPHFILSEPAGFVSSALVYIQESLEQVTRLEESKPMANIASCMEAIRNVLTTTPKAYIACTDSLSMMLSVLQIGTEE